MTEERLKKSQSLSYLISTAEKYLESIQVTRNDYGNEAGITSFTMTGGRTYSIAIEFDTLRKQLLNVLENYLKAKLDLLKKQFQQL